MYNNKIIFCLLGLLNFSIPVSAQNVGINKENPQYKLDVKGTVRIENVEGINETAIPLGWDKDTKQVVKLLQENNNNTTKKPFYRVRYQLNLDGDRDTSINGFDLGIDVDKFDVFLLENNIELNTGNGTNLEARAVLARPLVKGQKNGAEYTSVVYMPETRGNKGAFKDRDGQDLKSDNYNEDTILRVGYQQPDVQIKQEGKALKLYASFPSELLTSNYKYSGNSLSPMKFIWYVTLLVADKTWTKTEQIIEN